MALNDFLIFFEFVNSVFIYLIIVNCLVILMCIIEFWRDNEWDLGVPFPQIPSLTEEREWNGYRQAHPDEDIIHREELRRILLNGPPGAPALAG